MTEFIENNNKKLLWDLLLQNGAFNGQSEANFKQIQSDFEATITEINTISNTKNLVEKNKEFLALFIKKLNLLKADKFVTAQELQNNRRDELNNKFETMQNDFHEMIKVNKPPEIEFSDGRDDEPIKNMDVLLEQAAKDRQLVMESIKHPEPPNSESIKPSTPKSVSFNDTVTSSDTALLKEILENQKVILERLNKL